jgi:hypothetical protein
MAAIIFSNIFFYLPLSKYLDINRDCVPITVAARSIFLLLIGLWGYWHFGHSWPIVPASGDNEDDCGEADGM